MRYYMPYLENDSVFSCDKVRIHFKLVFDVDVKEVCQWLSNYLYCDVYESPKSFSYKYLFKYDFGWCSFVVGLCLNGSNEGTRLGFLEFNPNKVLGDIYFGDGFFVTLNSSPFLDDAPDESEYAVYQARAALEDIWMYLRMRSKVWELRRFDFASDFKVLRSEVQLIKDRRKYSMFKKSDQDYTEYLGSAGSSGYVKIYNKTIESELDFDCTRIEITLDTFDYDTFLKKLPEVYLSRSLAQNEEIVVELLRLLPAAERMFFLDKFGRKKKMQIKDAILRDRFQPSKAAFDAVCSVVDKFL